MIQSAIDQATFRRMQELEVQNFKWDKAPPLKALRAGAPLGINEWGRPLYMTFSSVTVKIIGARGLLATDNTLIAALGTSDPYAVSCSVAIWGAFYHYFCCCCRCFLQLLLLLLLLLLLITVLIFGYSFS